MNTGFARLIKQLFAKIQSLIKYGYVSNFIEDDLPHPIVQVSYLGKVGNAEIILPYGFSAGLPPDTPVIVFNVLGTESNRICIPYSHFKRFKNQKIGEVQVGNELTRNSIKFAENGDIEISTDANITVTASEIEVTGDLNLKVNGDVNVDATQVNLGAGGAKIARLGDQVTVGASTGTITTAGNNTSI